MNERQKRLIEVYEHLRRYEGVHTKTGFAEALHYGRTSMSAAMNGDESYLTDKLFKNICDTYPGTFNLDYLLNGDGQLLLNKEEQPVTQAGTMADMMELYAQRIRLVDDLRQSLKEELAEVRAIKEDMQTAVNDFRDATYRLNMALKSLNEQRPLSIGIAADDGDY
jgi:hypothetical protein